MDSQMMIWAAVIAAAAVVMLVRTFSKPRETVVGNDHIFDEENRLFYDLERIWRDGTLVNREDFE